MFYPCTNNTISLLVCSTPAQIANYTNNLKISFIYQDAYLNTQDYDHLINPFLNQMDYLDVDVTKIQSKNIFLQPATITNFKSKNAGSISEYVQQGETS
jgi:hypothetical protein